MTGLCLGALLAGWGAACLIPFLPFACALLTAVVLGTVWSLVQGSTVGHTAASALLLLLACQIGYGAGLLATALFGYGASSRRSGGAEQDPPTGRPLRSGNEPR